jgi:3-(3-hydroxy-phenyl)propionate hydroxylase
MARLLPGRGGHEIRHRTLYRVHQRVAATFRRGWVLLAGDAAYINNPLGGTGLNGGVHDAVNLAGKLARVILDGADDELLDRYDSQRRGVTVEHVQSQTVANKRNLEAKEPEAPATFRRRMAETAADPAKAHALLIRMSMIACLCRAGEIACHVAHSLGARSRRRDPPAAAVPEIDSGGDRGGLAPSWPSDRRRPIPAPSAPSAWP